MDSAAVNNMDKVDRWDYRHQECQGSFVAGNSENSNPTAEEAGWYRETIGQWEYEGVSWHHLIFSDSKPSASHL